MTILEQIIVKIIKEQETVIGPLAWNEAGKVTGLKIVNPHTGEIIPAGDIKKIIDDLVARYDRLFGQASHEVSRGAVLSMLADLSPDQIPVSLQK